MQREPLQKLVRKKKKDLFVQKEEKNIKAAGKKRA